MGAVLAKFDKFGWLHIGEAYARRWHDAAVTVVQTCWKLSVCVDAPQLRLPSCLAGELSPLVRRPPNSASPCMHPRRRSKAPDPKEQVKEWKKQMRGEERKLDRQITSELRARLPPRRAAAWLTPPLPTPEIKNEETKVKQSIKQAAKRGDMSTAKLLAKEIVRSRKAVSRLHTSKAQMNSVVMQMQNQMGAPGRPCAARRPLLRTRCLTAACHSGLWVCRPQRNKRSWGTW